MGMGGLPRQYIFLAGHNSTHNKDKTCRPRSDPAQEGGEDYRKGAWVGWAGQGRLQEGEGPDGGGGSRYVGRKMEHEQADGRVKDSPEAGRQRAHTATGERRQGPPQSRLLEL